MNYAADGMITLWLPLKSRVSEPLQRDALIMVHLWLPLKSRVSEPTLAFEHVVPLLWLPLKSRVSEPDNHLTIWSSVFFG